MDGNLNLYLMLALRLIHIGAGVAWVGGAVTQTLFIEPSVRATAPESRKFMQYFAGRGRYSAYMALASALTVLAGGLLYWRSSGGFQRGWITSGPGVMFTLGSIIGIGVYLWGMLMIGPRVARLSALDQAIGAAGGPPSPAQAAELGKLDREMTLVGRVDFALLIGALFAMSTARYWWL